MSLVQTISCYWPALYLALSCGAQQLPPIYANTPVQLVSSRTVAELPKNTFLENIAIAADGSAYINSHLEGRVYRMAPGMAPQAWAQVEGKIAGIAQRRDGGFLVSGWTKEEKAALFAIGKGGKGSLLGLIEGGQFPNGVAAWKADEFFVADSYRGVIYLANGKTGKTSVWLDDERLKRADLKNPTPGVNGLKVYAGFLYASNTARQQLWKIAIGDDGKAGMMSLVSSPNNLDDFALDAAGNLYATTHVYNSVVKVAPDGSTTILADASSGVTGCTALAFGRAANDRNRLYVVTNGGMSNPPPGGVASAKIITLNLAEPAASKGKRMAFTPLNVSSGTNRIAAIKAGQGPAIVIVHGIGGHKEDWQSVMTALADRHTVYALDMIGFGGSSKDAAEIPVGTQADAIGALLDAEHVEKASLIGNSVGGWVAATFAARNPKRVDRLVLVDAAGFKAMFEGPSPVNFYPETVEDMQKLLSVVAYDPAKHTAEFAQKALAGLNQSGDKAAAGAVFKGLFPSARLEDLMPSITAPTLVVWGAQDKLFPPVIADLVVGGIRSARKVLIDQAGHFPQLDNPERFQQIVKEFFNQ